MALQFIDINGARLAYRIEGPDDAPILITLHGGRGFGTHDSDWAAYRLLADTHRVLSFDFRGHGASSRTPPYTFKQIVDDVEGLRQHFSTDAREDNAVILGGSFGGFLALQYAITYPAAVSHLILRGAAASYHQEEDAIEVLATRLHKAPSFSLNMLRDKVFGAFASDREFQLVHLAMLPLYSEVFDADAALQSCLRGVYNAEAHNALYSHEEKYFDYRADLHRITAPTLVVVGDKDWICPPKNSQLIAEKIQRAELFVVPDANHSVHIEKNAQVLAKVRAFLQDKRQ